MDPPEHDPNVTLPPPPPRPPGVIPMKVGAGPSNPGNEEPPGKKLKPAAIQKYNQMKRPGFGSNGAKVELICNHFKVTFRPSEPVWHYNVTIDPPPIRSEVNRKVMYELKKAYGEESLGGKHFAYDGEKSLFVVGPLDRKTTEFKVFLGDDSGRGRIKEEGRGPAGSVSDTASRGRGPREFVVKFVHVSTIDMKAIDAVLRGEREEKAQDALRVLDIMMREHAAEKKYVLLKNSFFDKSLSRHKIGDGVELWGGYHVSFRPTTGGLSLNFDLSTTLVIEEGSAKTFIENYCKKRIGAFGPDDWIKVKRVLKSVMVTCRGRKHKVIGLSPETCAKQMFLKRCKTADADEEVDISVAKYFEVDLKLKLEFPNTYALDGGRASKPIYLPIEHCQIVEGQRYKRALTTMQRQAQIDRTRQEPADRRRNIEKMMRETDYDNDKLVKQFNVSIDKNMKTVSGRVLEPPKLVFGKSVQEVPRNGRWNFGAKTMKTPASIPNWAVVYFRGRFNLNARQIATDMKSVCGQRGMKLGEFFLVEEDPSMSRRAPLDRVNAVVTEVGSHLSKFTKPNVPDDQRPFILAILPEKSPDLYVPFKRKCEVEIGILTQCIVPPKGQVNPKYLTSVSLKINLKRGGYNSVLAFEEQKSLPKVSQRATIIFGLDVSHGSPGDGAPSVAAAVATLDWPRVSKFTTSIRAQPAKMEVIHGLHESPTSGMVRELLLNFYRYEGRNVKPEQILIFRDGVSESQFDEVLETELTAFKLACASMDSNYNPKITMVIVQKRHHTRFFPARGGGNVTPGTIVDKDPCHPGSYDFYLCSHAGIIGTSRPTHYHVLYDEIRFSPDELQHITNCLCYSYTRCTSAVSVVAPAYYAHLAAQHCRSFMQDNYDSGSESSLMSVRIAKATAAAPVLKEYVRKNMFYA